MSIDFLSQSSFKNGSQTSQAMRTTGDLVSGDRTRKVSIQGNTTPWYKDYRILVPMISVAALATCYLLSPSSKPTTPKPNGPPPEPPKPKYKSNAPRCCYGWCADKANMHDQCYES